MALAPTRPRGTASRWLTLAVLAFSLLVVALDLTVLNVAIPTLSTELEPSSVQLLWIVDIYSLMVAGFLISAGTLGDRWGRKRLVLLGFALFGGASALAAWSNSPNMLITARALLGVSAAVIMPSTLSIIRNVFTDRRERTLALGIWASVASAGAAVGPVLAGFLLERFWWGSVFLINLPVMGAALVFGAIIIPESRDPDPPRWDWIGALLSVAGLMALVYGIQHIGADGLQTGTVLPTVAGAALLVVLVVWLRRTPHPLINLAMFRRREFSVAVASVVIAMFGVVGLMFLLTQHLQLVMGYTPLEAGLRMLPMVASTMIGATLMSYVVPRFGTRSAVTAGLLLTGLSLIILTSLDVETGYGTLALALAGMGAGAGIAMTAASDSIMSTATAEQAGGAAGIEETSYELGGGLSVAVLGSVAAFLYGRRLDDVTGVPGSAMETARESVGNAAAVAAQLPAEIGGKLTRAANASFAEAFALTATVSGVVIIAISVGAFLLLPAHSGRTAAGADERHDADAGPGRGPGDPRPDRAAAEPPRPEPSDERPPTAL